MTHEVNNDNFQQQVLDSVLPVLVEFGAEWCPPCKMLAPILKELAQKYEGKLQVVTVDTDVNPQLQTTYGVMGLPTLILFQNGAPVQRSTGFKPLAKIEAQILPHLSLENA